MSAHSLDPVHVDAALRGLPAARAALAGHDDGDMVVVPLVAPAAPTTCPGAGGSFTLDCEVCAGVVAKCPTAQAAFRKVATTDRQAAAENPVEVVRLRTTRVTLDVDWDPRTADDPSTWRWDLGVEPMPGTIRVVAS